MAVLNNSTFNPFVADLTVTVVHLYQLPFSDIIIDETTLRFVALLFLIISLLSLLDNVNWLSPIIKSRLAYLNQKYQKDSEDDNDSV